MDKFALVFGADEFGKGISSAMDSLGIRTVLVNIHPESKLASDDIGFEYCSGSLSDGRFMESLDIDRAHICICALKDDFMSALECVRILRLYGAGYIVAEADDEMQEHYLRLGGASKIVHSFGDYALITAAKLLGKDELEFTYLNDVQALFQRKIPDSWAGKTPAELDIRRKYSSNVLGVRRNGNFLPVTEADFVFKKADIIYALGDLRKVFDSEE